MCHTDILALVVVGERKRLYRLLLLADRAAGGQVGLLAQRGLYVAGQRGRLLLLGGTCSATSAAATAQQPLCRLLLADRGRVGALRSVYDRRNEAELALLAYYLKVIQKLARAFVGLYSKKIV